MGSPETWDSVSLLKNGNNKWIHCNDDVPGLSGDSWLPSGEVRTRAVATSSSFAAQGKELLLTSADGAVARLHLPTGEVANAAAKLGGHSHATCPFAKGIARLVRGPEGPALFLA